MAKLARSVCALRRVQRVLEHVPFMEAKAVDVEPDKQAEHRRSASSARGSRHEVCGGRRVDSAVSPESKSAAPPLSAAEALAATPFFGELGTVELARLVPDLEERRVEPGGTVYQEGDPADAL